MNKLKIRSAVARFIFAGILIFSSFMVYSEQEYTELNQAELEQILAPIALYPDSVLSHILVASTYPLEVVQAERWIERNPELQGRDAVAAAEQKDWDPSVQALVAFPQILNSMSKDLDWTQSLGDAFLHNEEQVLAGVQTLRELAEDAGSLDEMDKVTVTRDERNIVIEPREREIVYVPYYDTRSVYGHWRWQNHQPIFWDYPYADSPYYDDYYRHNQRSSFYWGPRISLSFGFFSNAFHWRNRHVVRISSHHYRPHRYYGHYDILDHHYAGRWVHDSGRRFGNRNRHIVRRDYRNIEDTSGAGNYPTRNGIQIQQSQIRQRPQQEQVQNQLANRRNNAVLRNNSPRQSSTRRNATTNSPSINSRVVLPGQARAIENRIRRANTPPRSQATRQANAPQRANRAPVGNVQPAVRAPQPKRAVPKAVAAERKSQSRRQSTPRNERRQPR